MPETKYTFSISEDFPNQKVNLTTLTLEIQQSEITIALAYINSEGDICDIYFKTQLSEIDTTSTLPTIVANHQGNEIIESLPTAPTTPDGVPIVRADSRPIGTETFFTMAGDNVGIGDGKLLMWDFSNDDDIYEDELFVPPGFKAKKFTIQFHCPVYLKDGAIYYFDAPWGQNVSMFVGIPAGSYYPNPAGTIPASALGLTGNKMYAYTEVDIPYQSYLNRYHIHGNCPMGNELNAEGAAINAIPPGWNVCGIIITPESDNISRGFAALELYRCHTMLLPGQTIESIHS